MPQPHKIWLVIPIFNHGSGLLQVLPGISQACKNILIVDDGSDEKIDSENISRKDAIFICHEKNMGKGAAIMTAAKFISKSGGDYMITIDADGQHAPSDINLFIELIGKCEERRVIIGNRDFSSATIPLASRFGRLISNIMVYLETGKWIPDTQSGFRAYPMELFRKTDCKSSRYDFETEILTKAILAGFTTESVSISVTYPKNRISHFKLLRDNMLFTVLHAKLLQFSLVEKCKIWRKNQRLQSKHRRK